MYGQCTIVVLGVAIIAISCGPSDADFSEFANYVSPDEKHTVIVDSAHSILSYGPETIRIYVAEGSSQERRHVVTTKIANDGTGISPKNLEVMWIQVHIVRFCLSGVEQKDSVLEVNTRTFTFSERSERCSN